MIVSRRALMPRRRSFKLTEHARWVRQLKPLCSSDLNDDHDDLLNLLRRYRFPSRGTMTRPSLIPASAPTSPAVTRSKSDRNPPTTPQRAIHSSYIYQTTSPLSSVTVSTPYTPQSFHSLSSSNCSSLATPASYERRRLSPSFSPEANTNANKSIADATGNWRTRTIDNGIKITSGQENQFLSKYMRCTAQLIL